MQISFYNSTQSKLSIIRFGLFLCIASVSALAAAHNKVVVIPMAGDQATYKPFAPVTAVNSANSNYIIDEPIATEKTTGLQWQRYVSEVPRTWEAAGAYCKSRTTGGKNDWRVPSIRELISIISYDQIDPAINITVFPDFGEQPEGRAFWSMSSYYPQSSKAWTVAFDSAEIHAWNKGNSFLVRCVRGLGNLTSLFQDNNNGSVTDLATGLIWQQQDDNVTRNYASAINYCNGLSLAGSSNWRLPNIKELLSIFDDRDLHSIDPMAANNKNIYWSATVALDPTKPPSSIAWVVTFDVEFSQLTVAGFKTGLNHVRCVRSLSFLPKVVIEN